MSANDTESKRCPKCTRILPTFSFYKDKSNKDGLTTYCRTCHQSYVPKKTRKQANTYFQRWKTKHYDSFLLDQTRSSARRHGKEFNLTKDDLAIPPFCPILGIPLFRTPGKRTDNTPSVDRTDNSVGYVKGNVRVISWRANQLKRDATVQELEALLAYMKSFQSSSAAEQRTVEVPKLNPKVVGSIPTSGA